MIRLLFLVCCVLLAAALTIPAADEAHASQQGVGRGQPVYVPAQHGDCVNTFTVRLMVAASNAGAAWGEYEGSRFMIVRKGNSPGNCWLELGQWSQDNRLEDSKRLQCLFVNPLEGG